MIRLQKVLAQAGLASRRKAEALIVAGHVRVNGEVVQELGAKVDPESDRIEVDGKQVRSEPLVYYLLNKPVGVVTTASDPQGRRTVLDLVPPGVRVYPVGRLDYNTEGLLLLTNDGDLTFRLAHPSFEVDKVYDVTLEGRVTNQALDQLVHGVRLDDGITSPARVKVLERRPHATRMLLTIHEGRNRQVRRMAEAVGHRVMRLRRVEYGPLKLSDLRPGAWRSLTRAEVSQLRKMVTARRS